MSAPRGPLLPEDWGDLQPLLDRLLDASPADRPALLAELAGNHPGRRAELERLLAECERDLAMMERPAAEQFPELLEEDPGPPMPEVIGGRYRLERELGMGGMARVYLAQDIRYRRPVAIKVIRHEIAATLGRDRFLREIGIAARLRHPNIMPLYDSGDVDGLLYFVMPYEEGKSLRVRIQDQGPLAIADALSILRDVARALAHAHGQGVVHRDIKPDNVLLSGNAAVVTDFGIAKAFTAAASDTVAATVTHAGSVIGTPAYMAPEQAVGDPATDFRADLYAFGCLAYEVFGGRPPFLGETPYQVVAAQLSVQPDPIAARRPDIPDAVARLIDQCLRKDPAERPRDATAMLEILTELPTTTEARAARPGSRVRSRLRLVAGLTGLAVVLLGGFSAIRYLTRGGPVTLAVLPLQVAGDSSEVLAQGLREDLFTSLAQVPWIQVMSKGGAAKYAGGDVDPTDACASLQVSHLLMGSLRQPGGLVLTLRLIRCADGSVVWTEQYPRPANLSELKIRIVRIVADTLQSAAGRFARDLAYMQRRPINSDAFNRYLLGKQKLTERGRSIAPAIALFHEAIVLDSNSAEAWSGLSLALALSPAFAGVHVDSVITPARLGAERALRLDPTLAEPHVTLGVLHTLQWRWAEAEAEFKRATELFPRDVESRVQYSRLMVVLSRNDEALEQIEAARAADPVSGQVMSFLSYIQMVRGQLDSARTWSDLAMTANPDNMLTRIFRATLLMRTGERAEARALVEQTPPHEPLSLYVLAANGDTAAVRQRLEVLERSGNQSSLEGARAHALLGVGDTARGLDAMERAIDRREIWPTIFAAGLPVFDGVRSSPRFHAILRRVHIPIP